MNYSIIPLLTFNKQLKRLIKKYPYFKIDFSEFIKTLYQQPIQGDHIGNNCYKVRIAITAKNKGKSGGARVITHFVINKGEIYLLSIYDKSERENITENEIKEFLKLIDK